MRTQVGRCPGHPSAERQGRIYGTLTKSGRKKTLRSIARSLQAGWKLHPAPRPSPQIDYPFSRIDHTPFPANGGYGHSLRSPLLHSCLPLSRRASSFLCFLSSSPSRAFLPVAPLLSILYLVEMMGKRWRHRLRMQRARVLD